MLDLWNGSSYHVGNEHHTFYEDGYAPVFKYNLYHIPKATSSGEGRDNYFCVYKDVDAAFCCKAYVFKVAEAF